MAKEHPISVAAATSLIEALRMYAAENGNVDIQRIVREHTGAGPITPCRGEAHDPQLAGCIDNCMCCMSRWGWSGPQIVVKARMPKSK